jgi:hypothetical protein
VTIIIFNSFNEGTEPVVIIHNKRDFFCLGKIPQRVPAGAVFCIRVDVGIVPVKLRLYSLFGQGLNALNRTGGAAGMEQEFHYFILSDG